jgi:hypothetical protein
MFEEILIILLVIILIDLLARPMYQMLEKMLMLLFSNTGSSLRLYTFGFVFEPQPFCTKSLLFSDHLGSLPSETWR